MRVEVANGSNESTLLLAFVVQARIGGAAAGTRSLGARIARNTASTPIGCSAGAVRIKKAPRYAL